MSSLGRYYEPEFSVKLDYLRCDLSDVDSLRSIPQSDDMTYFLSVPPERYGDDIQNLRNAGLVDDRDKTRVIIEKPFGTDLQSANHLQSVVGDLYARNKYITLTIISSKDTVNNILIPVYIILEPLWNRNYIEEVQIFATETIGCDGRVLRKLLECAVRDMLQNHMLQILSIDLYGGTM